LSAGIKESFVTTIREQVDTVFQRLAAGELSAPTTLEQSGWEMALPSGKTVVRSTLQAQAQPLITLGADAIPHLLPWVMNESLPLRYVALYALEQITGEKPYVPYFDRDNTEGHRAKAIEVWSKWYKGQAK
jgi:hypothetical protein